jgi:hypothetical protein
VVPIIWFMELLLNPGEPVLASTGSRNWTGTGIPYLNYYNGAGSRGTDVVLWMSDAGGLSQITLPGVSRRLSDGVGSRPLGGGRRCADSFKH